MPQPPPMQVRWWQSVSVPGQVEAVMQTTQAPWPSQTVLPPQLLPAVTNGLVGMPAVQTSCVQALPSTGRSRSSLAVVVPPWPSQTFFLQSRAVCAGTSVPAAMLLMPHWPATQLRVWHAVSVPGQLLADRHSTQWEAPSHTRLPPHAAPDATGRWDGVP